MQYCLTPLSWLAPRYGVHELSCLLVLLSGLLLLIQFDLQLRPVSARPLLSLVFACIMSSEMYDSLMQGWAKFWPHAAPESFCAARRQQQKRFNVYMCTKSWDTRIFQISFIRLGVLTPANSCSHRLRIDLLKTTWCVSHEEVSTAALRVSTTFNTLPIES